MKTFTKQEIGRIKGMILLDKTQYQIAKALHTRKQNVSTYLKSVSLGVRSAFQKDVTAVREITEDTYKHAVQSVKFSKKWLDKRTAKLSEADRVFQEEWAKLSRERRAAKWSEGRGYPEGMSEKLREDYEDYWETPE